MNALSTETEPLHVSSAAQIFELTESLGSAEGALVVWKLRGWLIHNQTKKTHISYRDGRWWTYSSLEKWCERDFKWLTARQLGTIMKKLEDMEVIVRRQYGANELKMSYWYSINEDVIEALIAKTKRGDASNDSAQSSDKNVESKTAVKQKQTLKTKTLKNKQQPLPDTTVVVASLPYLEPETESGEYSAKGEGHDDALKAFAPHEQRSDTPPISKVPLKVLSTLADELVKFGILPHTAQRLVNRYAEADIRRAVDYARASKNLINPPGFVIDALDTGQASALPASLSQSLSAAIGNERHGEIEAWRLEALRKENARFAAEESDTLSIKTEKLPG